MKLNKKGIASFELSILILSMFAFAFILSEPTFASAASSLSDPSACCEKTDGGAWCINAPESECNDNFLSAPTSCETTSYCRLGTCYDSGEGICMENTPQRVCNTNGGTWDAKPIEEVPQCQLGCCIIADQAAFVSLVRCKRLSTLFGVENNYKTDITDEVSCIAEAQSQDIGACVYEKDFERLCEFTTRGECGASQSVQAINSTNITVSSQRTFYKDYLCSADELSTTCAKQAGTTCYQGDVYWADSCGNRENIYYDDKVKSWSGGRVLEADSICDPNDGSDMNCGNCDYLLGSRCAEFDGFIGGPKEGDNYCRTNECIDRNGDERINGESWCVYDGPVGEGTETVGSRDYREVCVDGEVRVEPCADYRNEVCLTDSIPTTSGEFATSACRVNRWQTCFQIQEEEDCLNVGQVDCAWLPAVTGMVLGSVSGQSSSFSNPTGSREAFSNPTSTGGFTGNAIVSTEEGVSLSPEATGSAGLCVPNYAPGLKFWEGGDSTAVCGMANAKCNVVYEKGLIGGGKKCIGNCECLEESWALAANRVCTALGDCGGYVNYAGDYTDDGYKWLEDGKDKEFSPNNVNIISLGMVIAGITGMSAGAPGASSTRNVISQKASTSDIIYDHGMSGGIDSSSTQIQIPTGKEVVKPSAAVPTAAVDSISGIKTPWLAKQLPGGGVEAASSAAPQFTTGGIIAGGLQWAAVAYGVGQLIGPLLGFDSGQTDALSTSLAVGAFTYQTLAMNFANQAALSGVATATPSTGLLATNTGSFLGFGALGAALVIGAIIFVYMYKDTEIITVEFNCQPWQAPTGGNSCEECNDDNLICSEYRCKSLGQNCEIVNEGTLDEKCVDVNPHDVNPPVIKPNYNDLTKDHEYENVKNSPPGPGFTISSTESTDGCIAAFTPLEFGIELNEPAQCKIDFNHTESFDNMITYVGGSNLYAYNHTERFSLPSAAAFENSSMVLENGKDLTFFLRCMDKNGNQNEAEYAVRMCVDPTPDSTAPKIEATSISNGGCVAEEVDTASVGFYTNEPAECKWSTQDQAYYLMQNEMVCNNELYQANSAQLFGCFTELTGISKLNTTYYVRCSDQPNKGASVDRNNMTQSYEFSLKGSTALVMKNLQPNVTVF